MQVATSRMPIRAKTIASDSAPPAKLAPTTTASVTDRPGAAEARAWKSTSAKPSSLRRKAVVGTLSPTTTFA
jgi:hypothetical protein